MRRVCMATAMVLLSAPASAQIEFSTILTSAATNATVGSIINKLRDAANDVINKAQNAGSAVAFVAGNQVLTAINAYEASSGRLLNQAYNKLNQTQYEFFSNAAVILQRAQDGAQNSLFQAEGLINQAGTLTQGLPTVQQVAVVSSYRTILAPPVDPKQNNMLLKFRGYGFGFGKSNLLLQGKTYTVNPSTSNELAFTVPMSVMKFDDVRAGYLEGKLQLVEPMPRNLGQIIGDALTNKPQPMRIRTFDVRYLLLPRSLGTYTLRATYGSTQDHVEERVEPASFNSDNADWACTTKNFQIRSDGRTILGDPWKAKQSDYSGRSDFINKTSVGFQIEMCAKGHGTKGLFGKYEGYTHQDVHWKETWKTATTPIMDKADVLVWEKQVPIELPATTEKWILTFNTFEGKQLVANGTADLDYLSVSFDLSSKLIILRPRSFWGMNY